jgi:ligand-binding sensor domain-containing protein
MLFFKESYPIIILVTSLTLTQTSSSVQTKADKSDKLIRTYSYGEALMASHGPYTTVRNITRDTKGNIWLASNEGVFRYDGKSFANITGKISENRFFSVLEDTKGNFWFGNYGSGVYYYDGKSFRNFTTTDGLASNLVTEIYEDKTGNIWFGTPVGASRYDGKSFRHYKMNEESPDSNVWAGYHNDVNCIIQDKTGKFWFGTGGRACVYDGKTFTVLWHDGRPFWNVRSIVEDKKGNIWLGGNHGLWRYDGAAFIKVAENFVGHIYEDKNGNIWTSSQKRDEGWILSRYDEKTLYDKQPAVTEIPSKTEGYGGAIFGIIEAGDGSIWFGTPSGVNRYNGNTITDLEGN